MAASGKSYLSAADTAKLVRKALKAEFPGIKFSVRTSSGSAVRVKWTDGPTRDQVDVVTSLYVGSHGEMNGGDTIMMPHDSLLVDEDGSLQTVHFGASYIFSDRELSQGWVDVIARRISRLAGKPCDLSRIQYDSKYNRIGGYNGDGWNERFAVCVVDGKLCRYAGEEYGRDLALKYAQTKARVPVWKT